MEVTTVEDVLQSRYKDGYNEVDEYDREEI